MRETRMDASAPNDEANENAGQVPEQTSRAYDYKQFLRELEEMEGGSSDGPIQMDNSPHGDSPPEHPRYPDFVPDQRDMEQLAHSYLAEAVSLFCFSFLTGNCEEKRACLLMNRFEQIAEHLGDSKRREIIDSLDRHRSARDGDQWQVFKLICEPGFWSTPADMDAVQRVADAIPEEMTPDEEEKFGPEFLDTLRDVRAKRNDKDCTD